MRLGQQTAAQQTAAQQTAAQQTAAQQTAAQQTAAQQTAAQQTAAQQTAAHKPAVQQVAAQPSTAHEAAARQTTTSQATTPQTTAPQATSPQDASPPARTQQATAPQTTAQVAPQMTHQVTSPGAAFAKSPSLGYGLGMQHAIEAVHATVALASRSGAAQAKIALEPAELGAVKIHLTQTSEGIAARVTASTSAGAVAIASGEGDLRGMLSSLGVTLLSLDVGSSAANGGNGNGPERFRSGGRRAGSTSSEADEVASTSAIGVTKTIELRTGTLVDVLA